MQQLELEHVNPRYMWLDPASGKRDERLRSVRARSAIVVIGTSIDQKVWVLDSWAKRVGTQEITRVFVDMVQKWNPVVAGFEDMGQQALLTDPLYQEAENRGISVPLAPVRVNTKVEKNWRIRSQLQPLIGHGRLVISRELIELKAEITQFPMSNMKDMIDALAGACSLVPPPRTKERQSQEAQDLARYLRETGASPSDIEDAMRKHGGYNQSDYMPQWQRQLRSNMNLNI